MGNGQGIFTQVDPGVQGQSQESKSCGQYNVQVLVKDEITHAFEDDPQLVTKLYNVYREVYGGEPWNEGWINNETGKVVSLSSYNQLDADKEGYKPYYTEEAFQQRVESELLSNDQEPFLILLRDNDEIVGVSWGAKAPLDIIVGRIGQANYSHFEQLGQTWELVFPQLINEIRDNSLVSKPEVLYTDEILIRESFRSTNQSVQLIDSLFQYLLNANMEYVNDTQRLTMLFRTLDQPNAPMMHIAGNLARAGLFTQLAVQDDCPGIVYFISNIPKDTLVKLKAASQLFGGVYKAIRAAIRVKRSETTS